MPSTFFTAALAINHGSHPYNNMNSTLDLKIQTFIPLVMQGFQTFPRDLRALHDFPIWVSMSHEELV